MDGWTLMDVGSKGSGTSATDSYFNSRNCPRTCEEGQFRDLFQRSMGACLLGAALIAGGLWRTARAEKTRNFALLSHCLLPIFAIFALSRITTPVFIDRIFIASSAVFPIIFAFPLAAQKGRRGTVRVLYSSLAILLAVATALSVVGFLRYQQKENYRGAISFLLAISESNRLIVFLSGGDKELFDYYSQRVPARVPGVVRTALRWSFLGQFPRPTGKAIDAIDISRLKLWLARDYSEVDLVLSRPQDDPNELILNYVDRVLVRRDEQWFTGITNHPIYTAPALRTQNPSTAHDTVPPIVRKEPARGVASCPAEVWYQLCGICPHINTTRVRT